MPHADEPVQHANVCGNGTGVRASLSLRLSAGERHAAIAWETATDP
jgi:hypothetical protein